MSKTTKEVTVLDELSRIQKELKAPKGQYNKFGNYKYRSAEDILEAVKPLLGSCSLVVEDSIVVLGTTSERFYIRAEAQLMLNDQKISAVAYAREPESKKGMDTAQVTGSTSSYARKYALNGLLAIDDARDADTMDNSSEGSTTKKAATTKKPAATKTAAKPKAVAKKAEGADTPKQKAQRDMLLKVEEQKKFKFDKPVKDMTGEEVESSFTSYKDSIGK